MSHYDHLSAEEKVAKLNELIEMWREPELCTVLPAMVIPDTTNRENTGLSPNHVHYIADKMQRFGFVPRCNDTGAGHDLPILVRETAQSTYGKESLQKWSSALEKKPDLPRTALGLGEDTSGDFFCSLGNGHFFQALNLFGTKHKCKFPESTGHKRYWTMFDAKLHHVVNQGLPCVVLRNGIPLLDRKFISIMLNSTFEFRWILVAPERNSSEVRLDNSQTFRSFTTLDGLTKHADAFELDEIIDQKMQFDERNKKSHL